MERPAETSAVAAAIALLIARITHVANDSDTVTAIAVVIGFIPAAITWVVSQRNPK